MSELHFSKPWAEYDPDKAPRLRIIFETLECELMDGEYHNYQDIVEQCVIKSNCVERTVVNEISRLIKKGEIKKVGKSRFRPNQEIRWLAAGE